MIFNYAIYNPGNNELGITIDGGENVITTGSKGYRYIHVPCIITEWSLLADTVGNIEIDIRKTTYDNFPNGFTSISGTEKPRLTSTRKNKSTNLTTWNIYLNPADILEFYVNSVSVIKRVVLTLKVQIGG